MIKIGAHQSISGGIHKAILRAHSIDTNILQIFTKNCTRWSSNPIKSDDLKRYFELIEKFKIEKVIAHAGYLINLATWDKKIAEKSMDSLKEDIENSIKLKIDMLVLHPGSHKGTNVEDGIRRVAENLDRVIENYKNEKIWILLETTAGQGDSIGHRFEHLSSIRDLMINKSKIKFCIDTCHVFAAGYDISQNYQSFKKELKEKLNPNLVPVIHLNDSKRELSSRIDRHEHIGKGKIGLKGFKNILNDRDFKESFFIIETPKSQGMDFKNIQLLKSLIA